MHRLVIIDNDILKSISEKYCNLDKDRAFFAICGSRSEIKRSTIEEEIRSFFEMETGERVDEWTVAECRSSVIGIIITTRQVRWEIKV